jgi:hypothetical protein
MKAANNIIFGTLALIDLAAIGFVIYNWDKVL